VVAALIEKCVIVTDDMFGNEEVPHFNAPVIQDNSTGWGPCDMPDQFKDMPYQPFSKGDRLGKVKHT
jgi:translation initiation factor 3 subunit D